MKLKTQLSVPDLVPSLRQLDDPMPVHGRRAALVRVLSIMLMLGSIMSLGGAINPGSVLAQADEASALAACSRYAYGGYQTSGLVTGSGEGSCSYSAQRTLQVCIRKDIGGGFDQDLQCSTDGGYATYYTTDTSACANGSVWVEARLEGTNRTSRWTARC